MVKPLTQPRLNEALARLARQNTCANYGALVRQLAVPGPGSIAKLTVALEATMAEDAAKGRPLRAALCHARGSTLPAKGFFEAAQALGLYEGDVSGPQAEHFVTQQRALLFAAFDTLN